MQPDVLCTVYSKQSHPYYSSIKFAAACQCPIIPKTKATASYAKIESNSKTPSCSINHTTLLKCILFNIYLHNFGSRK